MTLNFCFQAIFKDKKLERLWQKAHKAGLEEEELHLLKKEFQHHQDKLDQFHRLKELAVKTQDGNLLSNDIHLLDGKKVTSLSFQLVITILYFR